MDIYVYIGQVWEKSMAEKYLFLAAVKPMFAPRNVDVDKFERSPTVLFYHQNHV